MHDTEHTKSGRVREQIHELSAGFRAVAAALGVPAGLPDEDDDQDVVDPEDTRETIIDRPLTEWGQQR